MTSLPPPVGAVCTTFLSAVPDGLVTGLYLRGGLGFGEWVEGKSDVDFVATLAVRPGPDETAALRTAHQTVAVRHGDAPFFDGPHLLAADLPAPPDEWEPTTGSDGAVPFRRAGRLEIPGLGGLDVWWLGSYGNGIFVPVRDATAGHTTYGAGRYLLDTVKGADLGREGPDDSAWVVDLNFSYNPSCAYDPEWACPLAPLGNRLQTEVPVGELSPSGG